jgi:protein-S-isoprenylcysteine O-methyltransferase Ste14
MLTTNVIGERQTMTAASSVLDYHRGVERDRSLGKKVLRRFAVFTPLMGAALFLPAWSLSYWQGWVFLGVFITANTLVTVYFLKKDPALIERRMRDGPRAEKEKSQKIIQVFAQISFIALLAFPGFDERFGWSRRLLWAHREVWTVCAAVAGDALVALGLGAVFIVFKANSYASSVIQVSEEQTVVSTGPYRLVRHPMYAGMVVMVIGVPIGLGSVWGLLFCIPLLATLVWRLIEEEKYLARNLPGYDEYREKTRYRLVPGIY